MKKNIPSKRDVVKIDFLKKSTMGQLSLFDAEEFYEVPKDLL
ncbi:hypothetical protein [Chryseobacterium balustinum]